MCRFVNQKMFIIKYFFHIVVLIYLYEIFKMRLLRLSGVEDNLQNSLKMPSLFL